ncbi:hypothetical protein [Haliangium sp.]|uniref:hypothetical protein n=1 Tax=Haliangium sp. TaxID=2663208 RepID=UPI003D0B9B92
MLAATVAMLGCGNARPAVSPPRCPVLATDKVFSDSADATIPGWPPYYPPRLLRDVHGVDTSSGAVLEAERGFLLHRRDVEQIRVLDARASRCAQDLGECERRVAELAELPGFWQGWGGRALLVGLGFLAGAGLTVGIAHVVE